MLIQWSDKRIRGTRWAKWLVKLNSVALEEGIRRGKNPRYRVKIIKKHDRLYELIDPEDGFVLARAKKKGMLVRVCNELGWSHVWSPGARLEYREE